MRKRARTRDWERRNSSLAKMNKKATYEQCRGFACNDIAGKVTKFSKHTLPFIYEIPEGTEFHFIGRVNTNKGINNRKDYEESFHLREYVAFSTINNANISRYKGKAFLVYDIEPEDIVHIFPCDSDTKKFAKNENDLTYLPSLWVTLEELEKVTQQLEVYNQITCKTKRKGKILWPFAIIAIEKVDYYIRKIAREFGISIIIVHPNNGAINYGEDLLYDSEMLELVSSKLQKKYGLNIKNILYMD